MKSPAILVLISIFWGCNTPGSKNLPISSIEINKEIVNPDFGGIGFHVFYHSHDAPRWHYEQVFAKRWRELNPSFARITDFPRWDKNTIDDVAQYLEVMKQHGAQEQLTIMKMN